MLVIFSEHEKMILHILGNRKMTVHQISEEFYHSQELPMDGQNYVAGVLRRIQKKCEIMGVDFVIRGTGTGRGGRTVWKERRGKIRAASKRS